MCNILCVKKLKKTDLEKFRRLIQEEYRAHWQIDNLPVIMRVEDEDYIERGFPLGYIETDQSKHGSKAFYLNNHIRIKIKYSNTGDAGDGEGNKIVGFEVMPLSIHQHLGTQSAGQRSLGIQSAGHEFQVGREAGNDS